MQPKISDDQLKKQLVSISTTYVLSQVDTLPLGGFDGSQASIYERSNRSVDD